jgi:hypothetical protein
MNESQTQAVLDRAATEEAGTFEWWTALAFEDGDLALDADPLLKPAEQTVEDIELRLYSL